MGGDGRFYGRSDTGNRRLSEEEIARLYARRQSQAVNREELLGRYVAALGLPDPTPGEQGFLYAFAQPAVIDDRAWDRAVSAAGGEQEALEHLREAVRSVGSHGWTAHDLDSAMSWTRRGADKWSLDTSSRYDEEQVKIERISRADLSMDGRASLFYGHAAEADRYPNGEARFAVFELGIAVVLNQFFGLVGQLYELAALHGAVDVGIAVKGIRGAISSHRISRPMLWQDPTPYGDDGAFRTLRCQADELLTGEQAEVVRELTGRLFAALYGEDIDPLSPPPTR